jgi:hypothetical protein
VVLAAVEEVPHAFKMSSSPSQDPGTSCCRRGAACLQDVVLAIARPVSVGSGHADVAVLAVRSRPGISKKLTTEEENEGRRIK